jgi:hypothetical protein
MTSAPERCRYGCDWHPADGRRCWTLMRMADWTPDMTTGTLARLPELQRGDHLRIVVNDADIQGLVLAVTDRHLVGGAGDQIVVLDLVARQVTMC